MFKVMQDFGHQPSKRLLWSTCGRSPFSDLISSHGGAFCIGISQLQAQVAAWRSVLRGKLLLTNSIGAFRVGNAYLQRFVWEIPIYKLNLLLGGALCVGNSYLQTQLERFVWETPIYNLIWLYFPIYRLFTNLFTNLTLKRKEFFRRAIRGQKSLPETTLNLQASHLKMHFTFKVRQNAP